MSDTPQTDAQACHVSVDRAGCITLWYSKDGGYVPRLLSERLERENAALREDKEILDWLDANVDAIMLKLQPNSLRLDVREIARKARKEGQP